MIQIQDICDALSNGRKIGSAYDDRLYDRKTELLPLHRVPYMLLHMKVPFLAKDLLLAHVMSGRSG